MRRHSQWHGCIPFIPFHNRRFSTRRYTFQIQDDLPQALERNIAELVAFLSPHSAACSTNVASLSSSLCCEDRTFPAEWTEAIEQLSDSDLSAFAETKAIAGTSFSRTFPASLVAYYNESRRLHETLVTRLEALPRIELFRHPLEDLYGSLKYARKAHEVSVLSQLTHRLCRDHGYTHVVDIGGGRGDLAATHSKGFGVSTTTVDRREPNAKVFYSSSDTKRRANNLASRPSAAEEVYVQTMLRAPDEHGDVTDTGQSASLDPRVASLLCKPYVMSVGLHTCGPLALLHMHHALRLGSPCLVNVGCCYPKLPEWARGVSKHVQGLAAADPNLARLWSHNALHLANGRHYGWSSVSDALRKKRWYYTAMTLAARRPEVFRRQDARSLVKTAMLIEDAAASTHQHHTHDLGRPVRGGDFSNFHSYLIQWAKNNNVQCDLGESECLAFEAEVGPHTRRLLARRVLQDALGRPLELLIHHDRALMLMERGYRVALREMFPFDVSSRNVGIIARRTNSDVPLLLGA
eukprot:PhM_4_TR11269/c0_g1_i1/m.76508